MNGWTKRLRDLFLLGLGTALFHNEFWIESEPRPIAVLVAGLMIGFVPALHADDSLSSGPLALLLRAMGLKVERVDPDERAQVERVEREDREDKARVGAPGEPGEQAAKADPPSTGEAKRLPPQSDGPASR